mmetsp:Transcript_18972/g.44449  ORF Transcript_18972/g.44449 Transcript_18972/m.44449 type:complete len:296 (-) Transcript_18972:171-1058(-)
MKRFITILLLVLSVSRSKAFLTFLNQAEPAVKTIGNDIKGSKILIRLDIGKIASTGANGVPRMTGNRLGIDGLTVELKNDKGDKLPKMPGSDGPNPQLSSGSKSLEVVEEGKFVDFSGTRRATLSNGAWELVWRKGANAGALICGFDVPVAIERNDAKIPEGRLYVTFPVWNDSTLKDLRERKQVAEEKAVMAADRLKEHSEKMEATNNLIQKALHFREACKAAEEIDYSGYRSYRSMPLHREMISVNGGLNICTLGTVWTKKDAIFGADHVLLGSASAQAGDLVSANVHSGLSP